MLLTKMVIFVGAKMGCKISDLDLSTEAVAVLQYLAQAEDRRGCQRSQAADKMAGYSKHFRRLMRAKDRADRNPREPSLCLRDGRVWCGDRDVTEAVQTLLRHDLIGRTQSGVVIATAPGRAYLRRYGGITKDLSAKDISAGDMPSNDMPSNDMTIAAGLDPFQRQHMNLACDDLEDTESVAQPDEKTTAPKSKRWINRAESPLTWLHHRRDKKGIRLISDCQFLAGERLRNDFTYAGLAPKITAAWTGMPVSGARNGYRDLTPTERQIAARQRYRSAIDAMGPGLADVTTRICCEGIGLEDVERLLGWPARSAKVVLGLALDRLVKYYGIG